jgi:K+-sensing histidine kinase KdpD
MRVERDSSGLMAALGTALAIAVAGLLVPLRDWLGASNVALVLAIVVVVAGIVGGRFAGAATGVAAALSFDYFHTEPFYNLRISDREDIIAAVLLIVIGVAVGEVAALRARSQREIVMHARSASRLEDVASVVAAGADLDEVWPVVRRALTEQLDLAAVRFEPAPARGELVHLDRNGHISDTELHWVAGGFALPAAGVEVPVVHGGHRLGRLILVGNPDTGTTRAQRRVAVALADQLAVAASRSTPLHPLA